MAPPAQDTATGPREGRNWSANHGRARTSRSPRPGRSPRRAWSSRRRPKPLRDRGKPVRRTRRIDQHHAPDPPVGGRRGHSPRAQPLGGGDRGRRARRGRPRHRGELVPGRTRRVLQVHGGHAPRTRRVRGPRVRRRRRRDHSRGDARPARARGRPDLLAGGRPGDGAPRHDRRHARALRSRYAPGRPARPRPPRRRRTRRTRADHHRHRGRQPRPFPARLDPRTLGIPRLAARGRHHRHRRLGKVVAHRRARAPAPARPARRAAHRGARGRPVTAQDRRGPARRPHPDERDRPLQRLHALAGDPGLGQRGPGRLRGHRRRDPHRGLRHRDRGDERHRPGRCGRRAVSWTCRST